MQGNELWALRRGLAFGTRIAICRTAMRERTPRSGFGFALTMIAFIAATILILTNLVEKFPRR